MAGKVYEPDFVRQMLLYMANGVSIYRLSKEYGIEDSTLRRWRDDPEKYTHDNSATRLEKLKMGIQPSVKKESGSVVLAIPDLHCPFHHPDSIPFLKAVVAKINPDEVVFLGDEVDFHSFSKYPKDPDGLSPGAELKAAIDALINFYLLFPKARVCVSNHTIRPHKLMKVNGLPSALFPAYSTMLNAPDGWIWHEHIVIDGVRYMHGDQGKGGKYGWTSNSEVYHQPVVVGHWHSKAGVFYDSHMFNVNAGCLIDPKAYVFDYARHSHKKPNLGCAVIYGGKSAQFLPMLTDDSGRWVGKL